MAYVDDKYNGTSSTILLELNPDPTKQPLISDLEMAMFVNEHQFDAYLKFDSEKPREAIDVGILQYLYKNKRGKNPRYGGFDKSAEYQQIFEEETKKYIKENDQRKIKEYLKKFDMETEDGRKADQAKAKEALDLMHTFKIKLASNL